MRRHAAILASGLITVLLFGCQGAEMPQASPPSISPESGIYYHDVEVHIFGDSSDVLKYTMDGSTPTVSSPAPDVYGNIPVISGDGASVTVKAIACSEGHSPSEVVEAHYTIETAGTPDPAFYASMYNMGQGTTVLALEVQPDGNVLAGSNDETPFVRKDQKGFNEHGFGGTGADSTVYSVKRLPDSKILIGGYFTSYDGAPCGHIVRLAADGSLDPGFSSGLGVMGPIYTMAVQADGSVVIGGAFIKYDGVTVGRLARIDADGALDPDFNPFGEGADGPIYAIAIQDDGKIVIGGEFDSFNGTSVSNIVRLSANGSLDTAFLSAGASANALVRAVEIQQDQKILVGGEFTSVCGANRQYVARLNADGGLDASFLSLGSGANGCVNDIAILPDGRIYICGAFTYYNGSERKRIARLITDGSIDTGFLGAGDGADDEIMCLALLPDGKIMIGGRFIYFCDIHCYQIARLLN